MLFTSQTFCWRNEIIILLAKILYLKETLSRTQEPLDPLSTPTWSLDPPSSSSTPTTVTTPSKLRKKVTVMISPPTDAESTFKVTAAVAAKNASESSEGGLSASSDIHFDKSARQSRLPLHSADSEDATWEPDARVSGRKTVFSFL